MSQRHKSAGTWMLQILIIVVLLGLVFFVFYGPTGHDTRGDRSTLADQRNASGSGYHSVGEKPPFALFTSTAAEDHHNPRIQYTEKQLKKVSKAAEKAGVQTELYAPKRGKSDDYLMEIRVFRDKQMVQLLYPNFDLMESMNPIHSEPNPTSTKQIQLSLGPAKWVTFKHGGYHLYLYLHHTYIAMGTAKINHSATFKKIAESLVPVKKIQP